MTTMPPRKVAIVHEWLVTYAGSEKVLEAMLQVFPDADIYTAIDFLPDKFRGVLGKYRINTSFVQHVPFARHLHRYYLALLPFAIEQYDLSKYDLVISNSHAVAKGCITGAAQLHVSYCYTPMRYAWELQHQYLAESGLTRGPLSIIARWMLHRIRIWDTRTAFSVDRFIACSHYIARRIAKVYRRDSEVIYPNVDVDKFTLGQQDGDFYVTSSRIVPYKKISLIIDAFNKMPSRKLIVIGEGPLYEDCRARAASNVSVIGFQPDEVLKQHLQSAMAFVFAAEEDFGIAPIEAQACGTPVIAFGKGGACETVIAGETGVFFDEQTPESIISAVEEFERIRGQFDRSKIRAHAEKFGTRKFCEQFHQTVMGFWEEHSLKGQRRDPFQ